MILVNRTSQKPLAKGQLVKTFRDEELILDDWTAPTPGSASSGRVWLSTKDGHQQGFYPGVVDAMFIPETTNPTKP